MCVCAASKSVRAKDMFCVDCAGGRRVERKLCDAEHAREGAGAAVDRPGAAGWKRDAAGRGGGHFVTCFGEAGTSYILLGFIRFSCQTDTMIVCM